MQEAPEKGKNLRMDKRGGGALIHSEIKVRLSLPPPRGARKEPSASLSSAHLWPVTPQRQDIWEKESQATSSTSSNISPAEPPGA